MVIIERGTLLEDGSGLFRSRITGVDGSIALQSSFSTITYSVFDSSGVISGHSAASVTIASTVYDTIQTGGGWRKDVTGYNFSHIIAPSAFPSGDTEYTVEYKLTYASGEVGWLVFIIETQAIRTS